MKKLYTFIICLGFLQMGFGQVATNYNAKWFFGVNTGLTWQTTDVSNKTRTGWGLTLGKSFNYNTASFVSFDIRGRFLRGFWYGQDREASNFLDPNNALSSGATNYKDTTGYAVHNFQSENYLFNLELVAHLNRLRERTRWDAYIFGGIGLNWNQTYGDYLDRDQTTGDLSLYNWDINDLSRSSLKSLQDGVYETALDGSDQNSFNFFTSSSLGVGLGYQVGKAVTIGAEHKTTFTNIDNFDGFTSSIQDGNDIYHYTNAFIRFRLFGGRDRTEVRENLPPEVQFTQPNTSGLTVSNPNYIIQANIKNVEDRENVVFVQNGTALTNFTYNSRSDLFSANVTLKEGQNNFVLTGNNLYGTDTKTTIVIYKRELIQPPVVSFIQPSINPTTVTSPNYNLTGNVLNVNDKNGVKVAVNGVNRSDFNFNTNNGNTLVSLNLRPGTNTIQITGTNTAGTDVESTTIIYKVDPIKTPPVVYFTNPSGSSTTVGSNNFTLIGKVQNVTSNSGVQLTQNGSNKTNFSFNPSSDDFTFNAVLAVGQNTFVLTGTNSDGSASATTVIVYNRATPTPPVVYFTNPTGSSTTVGSNNFTIKGKVQNVTSNSGVNFTQNGANKTNFSFNPSSNDFTFNADLGVGQNTFVLTGTNSDGSASATTVIVYNRATPAPPVVNITNPNGSSVSVNIQQYPFIGNIQNITSQSQAKMILNGSMTNSFSFNPSTGTVTANLNLVEGTNTVNLSGTNADGTDSKQVTIVYTKITTVQPPVVYFTDPTSSPKTVTNPSYTIRGKVLNVDGPSNVTYKRGGVNQTGFTYNMASDVFTTAVVLIPGQNVFELIGTNSAGSASATTVINYTPTVVQPPVVNITNPNGSSANTNVSQYPFVGNVKHLTSKSQVSMLLNGSLFNGFTFNAATGAVAANLPLNSGNNTVKLTGTNSDGSDSKQVNIIYAPIVTVNPPVVTFVNPGNNPTTVSTSNYGVRATIANVSSPSGVNIKHNGSNVTVFTFGGNSLTFNLNLNQGPNTITVTGTNAGGVDSKTTTIVYTEPVVVQTPPSVTFTNPSSAGKTVSSDQFTVKATILEVSTKAQISFLKNGSMVSPSTYSYSSSTNQLSYPTTLKEGTNTFQITATNAGGNDSKTTTVIYKAPPCDKPVIAAIAPNSSTATTDKSTYQVSMKVENITSKSQVVFNGSKRITYAYNASTGMVTANVSLSVGTNSFSVKATNNCGFDQFNFTIKRTACDGPTLALNYANVSHNQSTFAPNVTMVLDVDKITSNSQINVMMNNKAVPFNFSLAKGTIEVQKSILVGSSTFIVTVTNSCGSKTYTHKVTRVKSPTKNVPTVSITNPSGATTTVTSGVMTLQFSTTQIIDKGEIIIRVNGAPVAVAFNKLTNSGTAVLKLNSGSNTVKITVTNPVGSASDTAIIVNSGKSGGSGRTVKPRAPRPSGGGGRRGN